LVKPQKVTVQEIIADIGAILNKINFVLDDHEQRLQLIEELDLKAELEMLKSRILSISDQKKQAEALQAFKNLCDALGILDLDFVKS
jgi:acetylglutamate kinase